MTNIEVLGMIGLVVMGWYIGYLMGHERANRHDERSKPGGHPHD